MKIMVAMLAMVLSSAPAHFVASKTEPHQIVVTAKRFGYDPPAITVKKGEPIVLVLKSADVGHGLKFRELRVNLKAAKGKPGEVEFTPTKAGDFVGHCSVFCGRGHGEMTLILHVVE